ncbi:MAG: ABC transporter ATP-binding protein [Chloroflexota bacterium]
MSDSVLSVSRLAVSYDGAPVLVGVDLEVPAGSFTGLIGPNASGKSTLLRAVSRVVRAADGRVTVLGTDLLRLTQREVALRIGMVAQDESGGEEFTVAEAVALGRLPHLRRFAGETDRDRAAVGRALRLMQIENLVDRPVGQLSGGERQRVMIARALAQETPLLLLDEPTAHLDIGHQAELLELLRGLTRDEGLTVLAALHDLNLAAQYCDRLALLFGGRIAAAGSPEEVLTQANVAQAYGPRVVVGRHPTFGCPQVSVASGDEIPAGDGRNVHVIAGGGAGSLIMETLVAAGYRVTAGVLNAGDSDWRTARALGLTLVEAMPFAAISDDEHRRNMELVQAADAVVLAEIPFGPGNLPNLEAALAAAGNGLPVFVVGSRHDQRDYTGGRAAALLERLLKRAVVCPAATDVARAIKDS